MSAGRWFNKPNPIAITFCTLYLWILQHGPTTSCTNQHHLDPVLVAMRANSLDLRMDFTIAPVQRCELPLLLELIRELARFEKLEHEVEARVEDLDQSFFGAKAVAGALFARCNQELAGYAIYFFTFSSFIGRAGIWLEDVYVRPAFRKRGLGKALIEAVAKIGMERNCGRFEWTALNWNRPALEFYDKLGAKTLDEWVLLRLNASGLKRLGGAGGGK
jgi:GNAT superfamily N-acetyltransferase